MLGKRLTIPRSIHHKKKDGDWYIYLQCFAHENSKRAYKNTKKNCKSFKLDKSNAVSVEMTAIKPYLSICLVGLVWFARYCGKMYSRHLFSYGGLRLLHVSLNLFHSGSFSCSSAGEGFHSGAIVVNNIDQSVKTSLFKRHVK